MDECMNDDPASRLSSPRRWAAAAAAGGGRGGEKTADEVGETRLRVRRGPGAAKRRRSKRKTRSERVSE